VLFMGPAQPMSIAEARERMTSLFFIISLLFKG
jgi:hypothetical protein